jgi:hypothetical protein
MEALIARTAEHRMVGDLVLDAELTEPAINEIPHFRAELLLRADLRVALGDLRFLKKTYL